MKRLLACSLLGLPLLGLALPVAAQHSTYAGQEAREIKALSPEEETRLQEILKKRSRISSIFMTTG